MTSADAGDTDGSTGDDGTEASTGESGSTGEEPEQGGVEVWIGRDAHGVPHVRAATDAAAMYGLGWASADDRLVQMVLTARIGQGRLAEVVGPDGVAHDVRSRVLGFWRHAQAAAENLPAEHLELLEAYARGVDDWVAAHPDETSAALAVLGLDGEAWEPWTPAHSLAVWNRLADLFSKDPFEELAVYDQLVTRADEVGLENAIAELLDGAHPGDPSKGVVQASDVPADVREAIEAYAASVGHEPMGRVVEPSGLLGPAPKFSHAWAVSGERTSTGSAVLAGYPQIPVQAPNILYEAAIEGETLHARGIGVPGAPMLIIGYTPGVAWSMTALGADQRDLFRLEMAGPTAHVVDGVEHPITETNEVIAVRGGTDVEVVHRRSAWGPVVTSLIPNASHEVALKAVPFAEPERDTFTAAVAMMRARELDELREAIEDWRFPSANFVAASHDGHVFYTLVGAIPVRSTEALLDGVATQDGSSWSHDWQGTIPNAYKPWVLDPAAGYVFSANHRPAGDWYPLPLGLGTGGGGDTVRGRRLRELLAELPAQVSPEQVFALTAFDCVNAGRRDLVAVAREVESRRPGSLRADTLSLLNALDAWWHEGGSSATGTPNVLLASQISLQFRDAQAGEVLMGLYGGGETGLNLFLDAMLGQLATDPDFVPDAEALAYVDVTLATAWSSTLGDHPNQGSWASAYASEVATLRIPHLSTYEASPETQIVVELPASACPDGDTIWSQHQQTYAQLVDLAAIDESVTVMPPGNHAMPDAPGFDAQVDAWLDGTYKPAPIQAAAIDALVVSETVLTFTN